MKISQRTRTQAVELLRCAADLGIYDAYRVGKSPTTILAARELDIAYDGQVWELAFYARAMLVEREASLNTLEVCLEAALRLEDGWIPA